MSWLPMLEVMMITAFCKRADHEPTHLLSWKPGGGLRRCDSLISAS